MARIRRLDPTVVNQIAAGEVVERPASVVKELVENCLDAGATRVTVDVERGGTERITVTDDGGGISADDLPLAVSSHATSKLTKAEDLFRVGTMGFRGEALASIASVSRFRLRSRAKDADVGAEIAVEGDKTVGPTPAGGPVGTTVEARQLFFNTPARRKFLKTVPTEFGHLAEVFTRVALAHPRLHATLTHDGKTVFDLPATELVSERIGLFFGEEVAAKMLPVESEADGVRLWGFAGHPDHTKSTRKGQYVFLNGRPVQDRSLQHALGEAYRGLTMVGRHPLAVLFWEMPPERVDVNVHPQKSEVRLEDGSSLYRQLLGTLRTKFLSVDLDGSMRLGEGKRTDGGDEHLRRPHVEPGPARPEPSSAPGLDLPWEKPVLPGSTPAFKPFPETRSGAALAVADADREGRVDKSAELPGEASAAETTAAPPRVMQVMDTYIVAETDAGLAVIDQHALHERVMYEQLRPRVLDGAVETQRLLVPAVVELPPREYALAVSEAETFAKLGFGVDDFGGGSVALTSVPAMLGDGDQSGLFKDLLDRLGEGSAATRRDSLDPLLHMMSCKAAIKAGQRLSEEEMLALLTDRDVTQDAHHCPHGRPTALVLSRQELDKRFGRLG